MARRSGLGRGLGALIPTEVVVGDRPSALLDVPVVAIRANPHQPRTSFDEESLAALTASVREVGVLQPVLVRQTGEGAYELIAGERRWRAAKRAGLPTLPAIVREVSDHGRVEQALIENLHRQDLGPLEEAGAYQQLIEDFGLTHEQLSVRVGKSRAAITNALRLFQLPPAVQKLVADNQLTAGHARALLGTPDRAFQEALGRRAVAEELSVRAVEEAVKARNELGGASPERVTAGSKLRPPGVLELEELLSSHLDTRVRVHLGTKRGRVTIDFATLEDLERIYRAMTEPPEPG
ncbi:MAG TPA: ParB/RepB/Spo0J family partition protein [Acidimicrobiales bacterium]|nr:ParB/RepB/Spo0J family partition protein [Acidimicrobiales bacterium]